MLRRLVLADMDEAARTFQRNANARRFYEARGFALVRQTDGSDNEEKEPDALDLWRDGANHFPSPELP